MWPIFSQNSYNWVAYKKTYHIVNTNRLQINTNGKRSVVDGASRWKLSKCVNRHMTDLLLKNINTKCLELNLRHFSEIFQLQNIRVPSHNEEKPHWQASVDLLFLMTLTHQFINNYFCSFFLSSYFI